MELSLRCTVRAFYKFIYLKRLSENVEIDSFCWKYLNSKTFFFLYLNYICYIWHSDQWCWYEDRHWRVSTKGKYKSSSPQPTGCSVPECASACGKQFVGLRPAVEVEITATYDNSENSKLSSRGEIASFTKIYLHEIKTIYIRIAINT